MDQREALLAEFSDEDCELLFAPGTVPQERLDELMEKGFVIKRYGRCYAK